MRVIRGAYDDAVAWRARRRALEEMRAAGAGPGEPRDPGDPALEPAVVVSGPGEHRAGAGVLVEAVGADGRAIHRRLIPAAEATDGGGVRREDAIEIAIQEAWRRLVRHVGSPDDAAEFAPHGDRPPG